MQESRSEERTLPGTSFTWGHRGHESRVATRGFPKSQLVNPGTTDIFFPSSPLEDLLNAHSGNTPLDPPRTKVYLSEFYSRFHGLECCKRFVGLAMTELDSSSNIQESFRRRTPKTISEMHCVEGSHLETNLDVFAQ